MLKLSKILLEQVRKHALITLITELEVTPIPLDLDFLSTVIPSMETDGVTHSGDLIFVTGSVILDLEAGGKIESYKVSIDGTLLSEDERYILVPRNCSITPLEPKKVKYKAKSKEMLKYLPTTEYTAIPMVEFRVNMEAFKYVAKKYLGHSVEDMPPPLKAEGDVRAYQGGYEVQFNLDNVEQAFDNTISKGEIVDMSLKNGSFKGVMLRERNGTYVIGYLYSSSKTYPERIIGIYDSSFSLLVAFNQYFEQTKIDELFDKLIDRLAKKGKEKESPKDKGANKI